MSEAISRTEALELLEKLRHSWSSGDWKEAGFFLAAKVVLHSSHKGVRVGSNAVIEAFDENIAADELLELVTRINKQFPICQSQFPFDLFVL